MITVWFLLISGLTFFLGAWLANLGYAPGRWLMGAVVVLAAVLALTSLFFRVTPIDRPNVLDPLPDDRTGQWASDTVGDGCTGWWHFVPYD